MAVASASTVDDGTAPGKFDLFLWLALSAMGSWLLLAITNHITQNIASIPFLWMLPLTLYLASFIICFDHERWYDRAFWIAPALSLLVAGAYGLQSDEITLNARVAVPLYALYEISVFVSAFIHRRKERRRARLDGEQSGAPA